MQLLLSRLNQYFEQVPNLTRRWRWSIVVLFLAISVLMAYGMATRFVIHVSPEVWFEEGAQPIKNRDQFRVQFGSDEDVYIVYRPPSGDVFSEEALRTLEQLHGEFERVARASGEDEPLSRIVGVDSLLNARYQIAEGDTLISKKLIGADFPVREQRRIIADSQEAFQRVFYSTDYEYGAIRLETNFGAVRVGEHFGDDLLVEQDALLNDTLSFDVDAPVSLEGSTTPGGEGEAEFATVGLEEYGAFMTAVREVAAQPEYRHLELHYVGTPETMDFNMRSIAEAGGLLLAMVVLVMVILWSLFRSLSAVVWSLSLILVASFWGIGLGAWIGVSYTSMLVLTFMLVIAVGVASCVHILSSYTLFRGDGLVHNAALSKAYRKTGLAILLTTGTTMAAMLTLTLTDMPIIQIFGLTSAFAVGFTFFLIVSVFPVMLDLWHPGSVAAVKPGPIRLQKLLVWLTEFTRLHAKPIVISYLMIFVVLLVGASRLKVDSNFVDVAREGSNLQQAVDLVDARMMGGLNLEVYMDFKRSDAFKDSDVLRRIENWQRHVEDHYQDKVIKTVSLADIVKDTNKVMNEGREAFDYVPDDTLLTAQLLYLFNNANPEDRRELVSDDYSKSHIAFMMRNAGSHEYTAFFDSIHADLERVFEPLRDRYPGMEIKITGASQLMMEIVDHIAWTQLKSFSLALLAVTLIMMLTLGSKQAGLIAVIPNLLPALFTFGIMGFLGIPLNSDMLIVAPIIIGIAVDDTIHFLTHYRNAWFDTGNVSSAVHSTLSEVGQAVVFTTLILGIGFGVLGFSSHLGLAKPGVAGAIAIVVALLSDLLFLPALIQWLKPDLGRRRVLQAAVM